MRIHLIGIGGISMSAIAEYFLLQGNVVSGSDRTDSDLIGTLRTKGITVHIGHAAQNILPDIDLVIYTAAIDMSNPEIIRANELSIRLVDRATILGEIMSHYKYSIGIAGSHGKTTVTAMLSEIITDSTIFLGGLLSGKNFRFSQSQYFITEACEYCDSFLKFKPLVTVINNVDFDHPDYFKNIQQVEKSFTTFAKGTKPNGTVIINKDYKHVVPNEIDCLTFGDQDANVIANNIRFDQMQLSTFDVISEYGNIKDIRLSVPGKHNVLNALAAISSALFLKVDSNVIKQNIEGFKGTTRRFEYKGRFRNTGVIDDYAHHPNEIRLTLETAKQLKYNKLWCVFQPHTYSRTKYLLDDFVEALQLADEIILLDVYAAREQNVYGVSSKDLQPKIKNAVYCSSFQDAEEYLKRNVSYEDNDLIITMGAGNVNVVGENVIQPH